MSDLFCPLKVKRPVQKLVNEWENYAHLGGANLAYHSHHHLELTTQTHRRTGRAKSIQNIMPIENIYTLKALWSVRVCVYPPSFSGGCKNEIQILSKNKKGTLSLCGYIQRPEGLGMHPPFIISFDSGIDSQSKLVCPSVYF